MTLNKMGNDGTSTSENREKDSGDHVIADPSGKNDEDTKSTPRPPLSNYWRVLSFGSRTDHVLIIVAICASAASGVALPLMQIIFGNLVGQFNDYFTPGRGESRASFDDTVDRMS